MMRRWRGLATVVATAALALSLSACGSSSGGSKAGGSTLDIGVLNSTTGNLGAVGQQEAQGIDLAVSEINAAGGIKGKKIKLISVDDQGSVSQSTAGFKKLATTDNVPLIIGPGISAGAAADAPLADRYGVTQVLLVAQPKVVNGTKNVFEVAPPGTANSEAMVKYAADKGAKTAALIWANNPYGQEGLTDITAASKKYGISLESQNSWDPAQFNFTAQAGKVASANPDVVFLYGAGGSSDGLLLKAVRAAGYKGKIVGDLAYSTAATIPKVAGPAADTVVSLTAVNYGNPTAAETKFIDAFKSANGGQVPSVLTTYAYVAVKMAAAAMEKASSLKGTDIAKALQSLNYDGGLVGKMAYTSSYHGGPGIAAFKPVSFKNGVYAPPVF
ncbi:MAG: ABC transporter substrate-binding protein [Antricoccus sp.]